MISLARVFEDGAGVGVGVGRVVALRVDGVVFGAAFEAGGGVGLGRVVFLSVGFLVAGGISRPVGSCATSGMLMTDASNTRSRERCLFAIPLLLTRLRAIRSVT